MERDNIISLVLILIMMILLIYTSLSYRSIYYNNNELKNKINDCYNSNTNIRINRDAITCELCGINEEYCDNNIPHWKLSCYWYDGLEKVHVSELNNAKDGESEK